MKSTHCNADMIRPQVGFPKHSRSACRAEMHSDLSSLLPVADIDFGRSLGANMFLLEKGTHAEHRTGSPLALATMADAYNIRIGGYLDAQGTTRAMRGSRHRPLRHQVQRDYRRAGVRATAYSTIVLVAPVSLGQLPKSLTGGFRGTTRQPPYSSRSIRSTRAQLPDLPTRPKSVRRSRTWLDPHELHLERSLNANQNWSQDVGRLFGNTRNARVHAPVDEALGPAPLHFEASPGHRDWHQRHRVGSSDFLI